MLLEKVNFQSVVVVVKTLFLGSISCCTDCDALNLRQLLIIYMKTFGRLGEDKAASFLTEKGYEIVERNYRYKKSEVDLICKKQGLLVFVEVKTRSNKAFGEPETFVSHSQQKAILRAAEEYMLENNWPGDIRFDIIAIVINKDFDELTHLKDAFY